MKAKFFWHLTFIILAVMNSITVCAEDLRKVISLAGYWRFSIGDDDRWASPAYDDAHWDQISVPDRWENQGYNEYNGYAWYRKKFKLGDMPDNSTMYLMLGRIDDADIVYLNGKVLGKSGGFPPNFVTAYDRVRKYIIPSGVLKEDAENLISVKVYDTFLDGGIVDGPIGIYSDADYDFLSLDLSRRWKFHTGDNKDWKSPDFKDEGWKSINVPSAWENEGYENYDGYAWYRLRFTSPQNFITGELYLSLGKIDDVDDVYLNGKHIGNVYDLKKDAEYRRSGWEYNARRIYKIPAGLLNLNGKNTIAIRVYDGQLQGGIYEGPVGIMTSENYRRYRNKYYTNQSFWDYLFDKIYDD
jgi:sialate O-acetylesterase